MNIEELWFFSNRLRGESHPRSKLTSEQVLQIRDLYKQGFSTNVIANFKVSKWNVEEIVKKNLDTHLKELEFFDFKSVGESSIKLPKPIIKEHDGIKVVRDDLLDGGTKEEAFNVFIESFPDVKEWVYSHEKDMLQLSLLYFFK